MPHRFYPFVICLMLSLGLSGFWPHDAHGQQDAGNSKVLQNFVLETRSDIGVHDEYIEPTYSNLAKVYWVIGMHDLEDNSAVDNFLFITECDLYNQYFMNDIEWKNIREATRDSIAMNVAGYPRKFEIIVPIKMNRYDVQKEEFTLKQDTTYEKVSRIEVLSPERPTTCGGRGSVPGYPENIVMVLNRNFTLTRVPVVREVAELYIREQKQQLDNSAFFKSTSYDRSMLGAIKDYDRLAYLRLKITFMQFKEMKRYRSNSPPAVAIYTKLDGYEIYADPYKTKLLFKEDFITKRIHRTKREELLGDGPIIDTGEGALLQ